MFPETACVKKQPLLGKKGWLSLVIAHVWNLNICVLYTTRIELELNIGSIMSAIYMYKYYLVLSKSQILITLNTQGSMLKNFQWLINYEPWNIVPIFSN